MKKIIMILIAASFIFASCQKNELEEIASPAEAERTMEDLNVSPDFEWNTASTVRILLKANKSGVVYILSENGDTYQKAFLKGNKAFETSISVPTYAKEVSIRFAGKTHTAPVDGSEISLELS